MSDTNIRFYYKQNIVYFLYTNDKWGELSNMNPNFPIKMGNMKIPSIEHLYQASKYPDYPKIQESILRQKTAKEAKLESRNYSQYIRTDWNQIKVNVMRWCLRVKLLENWDSFSKILQKTEDKDIVEVSHRDIFWGAKPDENYTLRGHNVLGRLLMELREELDTIESLPLPEIENFIFLDASPQIFQKQKELRLDV